MQEGRLEAASPEMEAEQVPYGADWEGTHLNLNLKTPRIKLVLVAEFTFRSI